MDEILGLDYSRDLKMKTSRAERLYAGAGVGVQSSYTTLLRTLTSLNPQGRFIDLGSGYGRVGLVVGLLYPEVRFTGYEYVSHRVEASCASAERAGVAGHVEFLTQDLSDPNFRIPEAESYYLYDPFTQETYRTVFSRLKEIGREQKITVITKDAAIGWFSAAIAGESGWLEPDFHDEGMIAFFRSVPG
ncbi:MAG: methyltransferase [Calothrix sp. SM1_5_4]|nr:methyltransferase [Calothrix sp. SM1_5_4]